MSAWGLAAALLASAPADKWLPQVAVGEVDYPERVLPGRTEKKAVAAYVSGPGGRTEHCRIVQSSHVRALDEATCDILLRRAHFAPAGEQRIVFHWVGRDSAKDSPQRRGDPLFVHTTAGTELDYPEEAAARGEQGDVGFEVAVLPTGATERCRVTEPSASALLNAWTCARIREQAVFIPSIDAQGRAVAGVYRSTMRWRLN